MKRMKKILPLLLCVIMAVCVFTGCDMTAAEKESQTISEIRDTNIETVQSYTTNNFGMILTSYTPEVYAGVVESNGSVVNPVFDNAFIKRWSDFVEAHGSVVDVNTDEVERDGLEYTARMILTGEDGQTMSMTISYDEQCAPYNVVLEEYSNDDDVSLGEKMANAGGNIVVGLLVVFMVLIVLSLLISCFGLIGKIGNKKEASAKQEAPKAAPAPVKTAPVVKAEDNKELIAVIAAAIAASEGTSPEGFVVRSIRRLDSNKWR